MTRPGDLSPNPNDEARRKFQRTGIVEFTSSKPGDTPAAFTCTLCGSLCWNREQCANHSEQHKVDRANRNPPRRLRF